MLRSGLTQSGLARAILVDRSAVSQLLSDTTARLPNAQVIAACATVLKVSADWLLSLSDRLESAAELLTNALSITTAPSALVDEQVFACHKEAAGYKVRHVPATLPDMFKTRKMLECEYAPHLGQTSIQAVYASAYHLAWLRRPTSDFEIALPIYELDSFVHAGGYYLGISPALRTAQIDHMVNLYVNLYPWVRIYQFDSRQLYSAPITLFGPLLSVLYVGTQYVAFRDSARNKTFTRHFDTLIRKSTVSARDLTRLRTQI